MNLPYSFRIRRWKKRREWRRGSSVCCGRKSLMTRETLPAQGFDRRLRIKPHTFAEEEMPSQNRTAYFKNAAELLIKKADEMLYVSKRKGGKTCTLRRSVGPAAGRRGGRLPPCYRGRYWGKKWISRRALSRTPWLAPWLRRRVRRQRGLRKKDAPEIYASIQDRTEYLISRRQHGIP